MISRDEIKDIYSKRITAAIKKYNIDSDNTLFMQFINGLADIYTSDFLSKVNSKEITLDKICCHDIYPALATYINNFKASHSSIADDENNWKIRAYDMGYFIELIEDENLSVKGRLGFAKQAEKHLLNYHWVLSQKPLSKEHSVILNEIRARIKALERSTTVHIEKGKVKLSDLWVYNSKQLQLLSEQLAEKGFINDAQVFYQVFASNVKFSCQWVGSIRTLIYLMHLLFSKKHLFPEPALTHIVSNFIFKDGKPRTRGEIYTQYNQIDNIFKYQQAHLKERYLTIYKIHKSIFPKT